MKKILSLLLLALFAITSGYAKLNGNGYYRIWNSKVEALNKHKAFVCVTYNSYHVNTASGTMQNVDAVPLYFNDYAKNCDPASIIYVQLPDASHKLDLRAQGISMASILSGAEIKLSGSDDGQYVLSGKMKGFDGPIYSTSYTKRTDKVDHYILTTSNDNTQYKFWSAAAVDSDNDDWYLGVKPTLELNGKYYAPYYVSFPFETKSEGMKVYIVTNVTNNDYTLKEVTGVIPAATPVLIECSSNDPSKNRLTLHAPGTTGANVSGNKLKGIYYYNPDLSLKEYPGCVTEFDPSTMRVWDVRNGKLVLSTSKDNLKYANLGRGKYIYALNPNQSYVVVPSGAAEVIGDGVTISFDTDGGSEVEPVYGYEGDKVPTVAAPTKPGYTFVGWDQTFETFPSKSVTVKALWKVNNYSITFNTDGGSIIEQIIKAFGSLIETPSNPTKPGYTFAGWDIDIPETMPAGNLVITAKWTPNNYTIVFDTDGGSAVESISQAYGSATSAPANPTKEGHTFAGWEPAFPATMPLNGLTLKAKWQVNSYKAIFLMDDGRTVVQEMDVPFGSPVTAPATNPVKEGYDFAGWAPEVTGTMPAHDVVYRAIFGAKSYTVTFETQGGTAIAPVKGIFGTAITKPADPVKEGHTFLGWDKEIPATMPASDVTITAQWQVNSYKATFLMDDGKTVVQETEVPFGSPVTAPATEPVKEGFDFIGWTPAVDKTMPAKDVVYVAMFTGNSYTISFDTKGGTAIDPVTGIYGSAVTKPADPVREGYTFIGWDKDFPATIPAGNMTLTAKWQANQYTITFDSDGGTGIADMSQGYETAITAPAAPVKEGYTFKGWMPELPATMPLNGLAVKAQWQINQYSITFDSDGGTAIADITQDYHSAVTAPSAPVKEGYTFMGWQPEVPATMPLNGLAVKAQWQINQYSITFDSDGGTAVNTVTQDFASAITAPAAPVKEGYTFKGWQPELPATMPADGLAVKAQWQINQYSITFDCYGGTAVGTITQDFGSDITVPADPVRTGYIFKGWSQEIPAAMPAQNLDLKAIWEVAYTDYAVSLSEGWNWITFPMMADDMADLGTMLADGEWAGGEEIKNNTDFAAYTKQYNKWVGSLTRKGKLSNTEMYKINSSAAQTVGVKNAPVLVPSQVDITVNNGWNYISYLPAEPMSLQEALANYPANEGDVIKSQDASSQYSVANGWVGQLTTLYPGNGYMLNRTAAQRVTFRYPDMASEEVETKPSQAKAFRYADNMTVVATVDDIALEQGDSLVAVVDGEVRGAAAVSADDVLFLTIQGDKAANVSLMLQRGGELFATASTALCYESDAVVGSLATPTSISFVEEAADGAMAMAGNVKAIYTADGVKLNTLNTKALSAGTYIVYTETESKTSVIKINKK